SQAASPTTTAARRPARAKGENLRRGDAAVQGAMKPRPGTPRGARGRAVGAGAKGRARSLTGPRAVLKSRARASRAVFRTWAAAHRAPPDRNFAPDLSPFPTPGRARLDSAAVSFLAFSRFPRTVHARPGQKALRL